MCEMVYMGVYKREIERIGGCLSGGLCLGCKKESDKVCV